MELVNPQAIVTRIYKKKPTWSQLRAATMFPDLMGVLECV